MTTPPPALRDVTTALSGHSAAAVTPPPAPAIDLLRWSMGHAHVAEGDRCASEGGTRVLAPGGEATDEPKRIMDSELSPPPPPSGQARSLAHPHIGQSVDNQSRPSKKMLTAMRKRRRHLSPHIPSEGAPRTKRRVDIAEGQISDDGDFQSDSAESTDTAPVHGRYTTPSALVAPDAGHSTSALAQLPTCANYNAVSVSDAVGNGFAYLCTAAEYVSVCSLSRGVC